ncbi:MAG: nucleoid-associated protein, partial [Bacteroidota bacterium]
MTIQLQHLAVHELNKQADSHEVSIQLSEQLTPSDERASELVAKLHRTFIQKNDVLNGRLSSPEDALFPGYYELLRAENYSAEAFLQFSRDSTQALQLSLQGVTGAKGGYLVYAYYRVGEEEHAKYQLGIFLVRDANGLLFQSGGTGAYELHPATYLDIDRMALACRIKKNNSEQQPEVEVIKHARTQKEISDYFLSWLAVDASVSNRDLTQHFLEAVAAVPVPVDEETGAPVDAGMFREQVANFAMKSPGKTISIPAFEERFYGEEQPLQQYFSEQQVEMQNEFRFDRQSVRDYHFHKFKGKGYYFGCKHAFLLSGEVSVEGDRVIIDNPDLAEQILEILRDTGL